MKLYITIFEVHPHLNHNKCINIRYANECQLILAIEVYMFAIQIK